MKIIVVGDDEQHLTALQNHYKESGEVIIVPFIESACEFPIKKVIELRPVSNFINPPINTPRKAKHHNRKYFDQKKRRIRRFMRRKSRRSSR